MPDDKSKRGPADRNRVNVHEDYEVEHWTNELGCSAARLRQAVAAVGPMVADVKKWLRDN